MNEDKMDIKNIVSILDSFTLQVKELPIELIGGSGKLDNNDTQVIRANSEYFQNKSEILKSVSLEDIDKAVVLKYNLTPETFLKFWTIQDYIKYKPDKKYIIQNRIFPNQIEMTYGQSGSFKSLEMLYRAVCIASNRKYLGKFKTKQRAVGILSAENSKSVDKDRLKKIMRGLKLRKRNIPLFILPRELCEDILNPSFKDKLFRFLKKFKIEVLFMDTINPLSPQIDDNKGNEVTKVYTEILKPLSDMGIYVCLLHHTDKQGNKFLGSTKWRANCDTVYRIDRKDLESTFRIYCEKSREGEVNFLEVGIDFGEKDIIFSLLRETEPQIFKKHSKISKVADQERYILQNLEKPLSRPDLISLLKKKSLFSSIATFGRAISSLLGNKIKCENGVYIKI